MATPDMRTHLTSLMEWFVSNKALINYLQVRPMVNLNLFEQDWWTRFHNQQTCSMDCSEAVTVLCKLAGFKDPTGNNYNGLGNSTSMFNNLTSRYTNPAKAGVGSIVTFGPDDHVAMVYKPDTGGNPTLYSHGSDVGPQFVSWKDELSAHKGQSVAILNVNGL